MTNATDTKVAPAMQCLYCHADGRKVESDRAILAARFPHHYPDGPTEACICCAPDSEYRCPRCNGLSIDFAMHYATGADDATGEVAQCGKCGWTGEAAEAAPPLQPWTELEAVREYLEMEPEIEQLRRAPARETRERRVA
jgi:hypothetical protein